jgi:hypothetical protein
MKVFKAIFTRAASPGQPNDTTSIKIDNLKKDAKLHIQRSSIARWQC